MSNKYDVVIVPGGWSNSRHYTKFRTLLKNEGINSAIYRYNKRPLEARVVVAHSVGCLDNWNTLNGESVILLAPPYLKEGNLNGKLFRSRWNHSRKQELAYQRIHNRVGTGISIAIKAFPTNPAVLRRQYKLLHNNFAGKVIYLAQKFPDTQIIVIQYKDDVWTDSGLKHTFKGHRNISYEVKDAPHDDLFYHPGEYVSVIKALQ